MDCPEEDSFSDEQGPDSDVQLLHVASLVMNGISDKWKVRMPGTYSIKIDPGATPVVPGSCQQPAALLPKIIAKFKEMEKEGQLAKVSQPTDWVNLMVVSS